MAINIQSKNIEISPSTEKYINKRLSKIERMLKFGYDNLNMVISLEKHRYIVEVSLKSKGHSYRGTDDSNDLRTSINNAFDKIEKQIRRQKDRYLSSKRPATEPTVEEETTTIDEEEIIIHNIQYKPMTMEEALQHFRSSNHEFFAFIDAHTDRVNVLYRRTDGRICLLKPL